MKVINSKLDGVLFFQTEKHWDNRGFFQETFNKSEFEKALKERSLPVPEFKQDNIIYSNFGVLRGLHYQSTPHEQGKLVSVIKGKVLDIAVDLRKGSKTYGQYDWCVINTSNNLQMWIPEGFAHGVLALEDNTIIQYKTTEHQHKESEVVINCFDEKLDIDWGVPKSCIILSNKDKNGISFNDFNLFN